MVEPQPSKLMTRVRFPSPAPVESQARHPRDAGLFFCDEPEPRLYPFVRGVRAKDPGVRAKRTACEGEAEFK